MYKIIDPHLHLFNLDKGDYTWLKPQNAPFWPDKYLINKNVNETDLNLASPYQLAGFVHIEAGFNNQQPWHEIDWLEQHCSLPFKSVAFADITANSFEQHVKLLKQRRSVVGIRHILDEQALAILSAKATTQHLALLEEYTFSFDAQMSVTDTLAVDKLVEHAQQYPQLKVIINHGGWPPYHQDKELYELWLKNIKKLAEYPNIAIKLSAWEMNDRYWQVDWLHQVLLDALIAFGRSRVMMASNFPLCLFTKSYAELWSSYTDLVGIVDADCFEKISFTNAKQWYCLEVVS